MAHRKYRRKTTRREIIFTCGCRFGGRIAISAVDDGQFHKLAFLKFVFTIGLLVVRGMKNDFRNIR